MLATRGALTVHSCATVTTAFVLQSRAPGLSRTGNNLPGSPAVDVTLRPGFHRPSPEPSLSTVARAPLRALWRPPHLLSWTPSTALLTTPHCFFDLSSPPQDFKRWGGGTQVSVPARPPSIDVLFLVVLIIPCPRFNPHPHISVSSPNLKYRLEYPAPAWHCHLHVLRPLTLPSLNGTRLCFPVDPTYQLFTQASHRKKMEPPVTR